VIFFNFFSRSVETRRCSMYRLWHLSPLRPVARSQAATGFFEWSPAQQRHLTNAAPIGIVAGMRTVRAMLCLVLLSAMNLAAQELPQPRGIVAGTDGIPLPEPPRAADLRIAILPDRTTGSAWGLEYLVRAVEDLNRLSPDAVISIGDMIQGYTRSVEQWDREVREFKAISEQLTMPFYPIVGNHEVISGTRDPLDSTFHDRYAETFGPHYYMIEFDRASIIALHSDDIEAPQANGLGPSQVQWLDGALEGAKARGVPIIVLLHRPLWRTSASWWNEQIHPRLANAGVDAVIAGHFHALQRDPDRDGVEYHILGTCGGTIDQNPLAGQLHHLTFLNIGESGLRVFHLPVGMTLPDDFILAEDQNRVQQLKSRHEVARFASPVCDPYHTPFEGDVTLEVENPIDREVRFEVALLINEPVIETWPGSLWLSRMELDRLNPRTTDIRTSWRLEPVPPVTVGPRESAQLVLSLRSPRLPAPAAPPEFHIRAIFTDSQDREVAVVIRRRLPLERTIDFADGGEPVAWRLCAWECGLYEHEEPDPLLTLRLDPEGNLVLIIDVIDQIRSGFLASASPGDRWADPAADAILVAIESEPSGSSGAGLARQFFIEPHASVEVHDLSPESEESRLGADSLTLTNGKDGWRVTFAIPEAVWRPVLSAEGRGRIQVGVADNDGDFHTQWRWLGPQGLGAWLETGPD
jgi:hypothetical protein